jgi:hypothetical protein
MAWFEGFEDEGRVLIDPRELRRKYLALMDGWRQKLEHICQELAADYQLFLTDQNPGNLLSAYLLYRSDTQRRRAKA